MRAYILKVLNPSKYQTFLDMVLIIPSKEFCWEPQRHGKLDVNSKLDAELIDLLSSWKKEIQVEEYQVDICVLKSTILVS